MAEPRTYLGASSRHAYCTDYQFCSGVPLKMFGQDEKFEKITWLDVKNCTGSLYPDTFKNLPKLALLNITNCNFDEIDSPFKNMDCLGSLDIWKSQVPLNKDTFQGCNGLTSLRVINCHQMVFPDDVFVRLKNLENLTIQKTNFSVGENTFALENLVYIYLNGCEINFTAKNPFTGLKNLNFLGFENCTLNNISADDFLCLETLETLILNNNNFEGRNFDFQTLKMLPNLTTISFAVSVLENLNFTEFKKLTTVQFDLNNIKAKSLIEKLKDQNINYEWSSSGEIPEFDENDPNIKICA